MTLNAAVSVYMQIVLKLWTRFSQNHVFEIQFEIFLTYFIYNCPRDGRRIFLGRLFFFVAENVSEILVE